MTHTINLTQEQVEKLNKLMETRPGKTLTEMATQCINVGLSQLEYRTHRNAKQSELLKEFRAWKKENN